MIVSETNSHGADMKKSSAFNFAIPKGFKLTTAITMQYLTACAVVYLLFAKEKITEYKNCLHGVQFLQSHLI